jgi:hypothetical protein
MSAGDASEGRLLLDDRIEEKEKLPTFPRNRFLINDRRVNWEFAKVCGLPARSNKEGKREGVRRELNEWIGSDDSGE